MMRLSCAWAVLLLGPGPGATQDRIEHPNPRFSFRIPPGYARIEAGPNLAYRLAKPPYFPEDPRSSILIEVLPFSLPEGASMYGDDVRPGIAQAIQTQFGPTATFSLQSVTFRWRDLDIPGMELRTQNKGLRLLSFQGTIPAAPKAIRVEVVGAERYESDLRRDFSALLEHFEALPSWIMPRQYRLMNWIPMAGAASLVAAPAYLVLWLLFFRRKPRRLALTRSLLMLGMAQLSAASPILWDALLRGRIPVDPPGVCTWPLAFLIGAPWFMLGSARCVALLILRARDGGASLPERAPS